MSCKLYRMKKVAQDGRSSLYNPLAHDRHYHYSLLHVPCTRRHDPRARYARSTHHPTVCSERAARRAATTRGPSAAQSEAAISPGPVHTSSCDVHDLLLHPADPVIGAQEAEECRRSRRHNHRRRM